MRTITIITVAGALGLLLSACQPGSDTPEGLNGEWLGINYQCPIGAKHRERVAIVEEDGQIVATKLTGDDCVPAGEVTFRGTREDITCISGLPDDPASSTYKDSIRAEQANGFSVCGVEFERVTGETPDA